MRNKRSLIWKVEKEILAEIVKNSTSITEILNSLGFQNKGRNYETLKSRLTFESIDFSHIPLGFNNNLGRKFPEGLKEIPLSEILVENSNYNRFNLKKRLIKQKLLLEVCSSCGLGNVWNGKAISLQLDHINGISNDNRLENLRILCPNCHSQTDNFAGKSRRKN